jgi:putative membrane protein
VTNKLPHLVVIAAIALVPAVPIAAPAAAAVSRSDAEFLTKAAQAGHAEVEGSKIAVAKAVNTQVRGFAQQMIDEHSKTNAELAALALAKGVAIPAQPSLGQSTKIQFLSGRDGAGFDRRYAETLGVGAHRDALRLFQKAATGASDPDIKAFAAKMVPALQHHLEMATELKGVVDKEGNAKAQGDRKQ